MTGTRWSPTLRLVFATALIGSVFAGWLYVRESTVTPSPEGLPPVRPTPFLNTSAGFVGLRSCAECHPDQYDSFLQTAHSQALSDIDLTSEPPDGRFEDLSSGRAYEISRRDGQLRHRELVHAPDGTQLTLADLPMRYSIGSGRFSRSYLAERDGFLVESPATWYAARPGWALSPGYEIVNTGFERPIVRECINCHVGRADAVDGALHRFDIHSQVIDCERCHGAGSLHVERWSGADSTDDNGQLAAGDGQDYTIVHPGSLSRVDSEAICAQCHLHSAATVELRGRRLSDFRPGMRLADFCIHYGLKTPDTRMRVVGHAEQLRLSSCYQQSESLTCTTCHNPHRTPPPESRVDYYRDKCLSCHAEVDCGLTPAERVARVTRDDCTECHMPRAPTDIPHFAFTHHRIGVHDGDESDSKSGAISELVALDDVSHLPQIEQDRCLGLAYLQLSSTADSADRAAAYRSRARDLLESVWHRGLRDPEVDASLARLHWRSDPFRTIEFAESTLTSGDASPEARVTALFTLGSTLFDLNDPQGAIPYLEEIVNLRLYSEDWYILSCCYQRVGQVDDAIDAGQRAAEISPQYPQLQTHLSKLYQISGDDQLAAECRRRAAQLGRLSPTNLPSGRN